MSVERIGHGGASAIEPGNTLASFDAACTIGVDAIEFDVRSWRGDLVLAHTSLQARRGGSVRLEDALTHLAQPSFAGIAFHLDVKQTGREREILSALSRAGLVERSLLCSQLPVVLDRFRTIDPRAQLGISVGGRVARASHRWGGWRDAALAGLIAGRWSTLMVQHKLVDAELIESVAAHGSRLYAWTVNRRSLIESLGRLGVHGIATADPRLFG